MPRERCMMYMCIRMNLGRLRRATFTLAVNAEDAALATMNRVSAACNIRVCYAYSSVALFNVLEFIVLLAEP